MKTKILAGLSVISAALFLTMTGARPQPLPTENDWKPLTTEPSRSDLFADYAKAQASLQHHQQFAFPSKFKFPESADRDTNGLPRTNSVFGIDISHYEGDHFPVASLKLKHVTFIYVKATQGTGYRDPVFAETWANLAALPPDQSIPRGAFHFLASDPSETGAAQADRFYKYVHDLHGGFGELPPALDLEWDKTCDKCADQWITNHRTPEEIIQTTIDFITRIKQLTGRTPLLYTNKSFLSDVGITRPAQISRLTGIAKVWIFDISAADSQTELPNPHKNLPFDLWQFSWSGHISGPYTHGMDVDSFKGTTTDWQAFVTGNQPQTP